MSNNFNPIENDPVIARALELSEKQMETANIVADNILDILAKEVASKSIDPKIGFQALAKSLILFSQTICIDEEDFARSSQRASELIYQNVFPSLGLNADNEEANNNALVTYNGEYLEENFSIKNLTLISGHLINHTFWRLNYNKALIEFTEA